MESYLVGHTADPKLVAAATGFDSRPELARKTFHRELADLACHTVAQSAGYGLSAKSPDRAKTGPQS